MMYGYKWIANKWVKWLDQMWNYPCLVNKGKGFSMQHVFKYVIKSLSLCTRYESF